MQLYYHIPLYKLTFKSNIDYAEYFVALMCFGVNHPEYKNAEVFDFILGCDGYEFDAFINRNGISFYLESEEVDSTKMNIVLNNIIQNSIFPVDNFKNFLNKLDHEPDSKFQLLVNKYATKNLTGNQLFPDYSLHKLVPLVTEYGVERKFKQLQRTSMDMYATDTIEKPTLTYQPENTLHFETQLNNKNQDTLFVYSSSLYVPIDIRTKWMSLLAKKFGQSIPIRVLKTEENYKLLVFSDNRMNQLEFIKYFQSLFEIELNYLLMPKDFTEM